MEKDKKNREAAAVNEKAALAILGREPIVDTEDELLLPKAKKVKVAEMKTLLEFYGVEKKMMKKNKAELRQQLKEVMEKNTQPKEFQRWTKEDEDVLVSLGDDVPIDIEETALGPAEEARKKQKEEDFSNYADEFVKKGGCVDAAV